MKIRVCNQCGAKNTESTWNCVSCGNTLSIDTIREDSENSSLEDTGWICKNCGNFNVKTTSCSRCGKEKKIIPDQITDTMTSVPKKSKADDYYDKAWDSFLDGYFESDQDKNRRHYSRALGYLNMAYKAAGNNKNEKIGIAGLTALILIYMGDCKNAENWARAEFSINPTSVFANLAWYFIELDKWVGHKSYIAQDDGSGIGLFANIVSIGVDVGRTKSKKSMVKNAGIQAGKAIEKKIQTDSEPNPFAWILWSDILLSIIENMWTNNIKEPYLCNVILKLPWDSFDEEEIKDLQDAIEDIQVEAHGYLGRLK